jgi:hypothetical protein
MKSQSTKSQAKSTKKDKKRQNYKVKVARFFLMLGAPQLW